MLDVGDKLFLTIHLLAIFRKNHETTDFNEAVLKSKKIVKEMVDIFNNEYQKIEHDNNIQIIGKENI